MALAGLVACGKVNTETPCHDGMVCDGTCVDTQSDPANCGTCGHACDASDACVAGQCELQCTGSDTPCGTTCVNTQTDPLHCGGCAATPCSSNVCTAGVCQIAGYYGLTGTVDPTTVFNTIAETYTFPNNLTNSIWHRATNTILTGEFATSGYWAFHEGTTGYPAAPNNGADIHARMVYIPATNTVVYSRSASANGVGLGTYTQIAVAALDPQTGLLGTGATAAFSDGFTGSCQLLSASATQLLCYDGTSIRRYTTTAGSATLTFVDTRPLSAALPATAQCAAGAACYGSTFAFDGAYYYFAADEGIQTSLAYVVYNANGTLVNTYSVVGGGGAVNGVYFDWSVGRYSTHDGFGGHTGGAVYAVTGGGGSDTHCFGPVSTNHTLL
jgi:hypothetical protein